MKTIKDFTPEIQAKIPRYIDAALAGIFDGKRYNAFKLADAQAAVWHTYEFCGYKKPVVIVAENPLESQIILNYLRETKHFHDILYAIYCVQNGMELKVADGKKPTKKFKDVKIDDGQLRGQLDGQLYGQLRGQLRGQLDGQLDNKKLCVYNNDYLTTLNVWSNGYFAYYKFIRDEFGIETTGGATKLDNFYEHYIKSNIYSAVFSELVCVVSKYPKKIHRNDNKDLHNTSGVAVEWGEGTDLTKFNCYYINGRNIPAKEYEKALSGSVTKDEFIKQENEDIKAAWFEIMGQERVMNLLQAKMINKGTFVHADGSIEQVQLYKTKEKFPEAGNQPLAWVKFICPSTGTAYLIDVEPHHTDARVAAMSTSPFYGEEINDVDDYKFASRN